jgi:hypothetical protein
VRGDKSVDDVGQTIDAQFGQLTDDLLDRRTVGGIQRKVIKKSRRKAISRLLYAKNDKETIAGWKSELNRILHVFNVRLLVSGWSLLTVNFQAELAVTTQVTVSDTHTIVSNIRDDVSKIREGISGQVQPVSTSCIQSVDDRRMLTVS